ncbi:hypothetical protein [Clostridium intestinale]|uniref:Uncharacterized protein n=1 Tax=Clostridium intestinale TaxID=36845 RepID=A0A7D7A120_9CLOT|nr:hypothetical protein [Clostridium intestinale]QLY80375.1 hypothetical protein HZF06_01980 [Clostridium intestinale]
MFITKKSEVKHSGELIYIYNENSFDFKPSKNTDITLMIGYISVGIDSETMLALQIWGFSPSTSWIEKKLELPTYFTGELYLKEEIEAGVSKRLIESSTVKTKYDKESGWICIGDESMLKNEIAVEFATNTIAVLSANTLKSLWVKPIFK